MTFSSLRAVSYLLLVTFCVGETLAVGDAVACSLTKASEDLVEEVLVSRLAESKEGSTFVRKTQSRKNLKQKSQRTFEFIRYLFSSGFVITAVDPQTGWPTEVALPQVRGGAPFRLRVSKIMDFIKSSCCVVEAAKNLVQVVVGGVANISRGDPLPPSPLLPSVEGGLVVVGDNTTAVVVLSVLLASTLLGLAVVGALFLHQRQEGAAGLNCRDVLRRRLPAPAALPRADGVPLPADGVPLRGDGVPPPRPPRPSGIIVIGAGRGQGQVYGRGHAQLPRGGRRARRGGPFQTAV